MKSTRAGAARTTGAPSTRRRRSKRTERTAKVDDIVEIWWAVDKTFYRGRLARQLDTRNSFRVKYDDGETEDLDLTKEYWKFADDSKAAPPAPHQIVDVVLDGSHQQSDHQPDQQSAPQAVVKKPKPKAPKTTRGRRRTQQTSDDDRDEDYVEEQITPENTRKQKRTRPDSEKQKKRSKPTLSRKQTATSSEQNATNSRHPSKTLQQPNQPNRRRVDHPNATSHLSPVDQTIPAKTASVSNTTKTAQTLKPLPSSHPEDIPPRCKDSGLTPPSPAEAEGEVSKLKSDSQIEDIIPASTTVPNTRTFHPETLQKDKTQNVSNLAATKTTVAESVSHDTNANPTSDQPSAAPPSINLQDTDTAVPSKKLTSLQQAQVVSQRDLATIQAEPSLLPTDRGALSSRSDPVPSVLKRLVTNDSVKQLSQSRQASPVEPLSTTESDPARASTRIDPVDKMPRENPQPKELVPSSAPARVSTRASDGSHNLSESDISDPGRIRRQISSSHEGIADSSDAPTKNEDRTGLKRRRGNGEVGSNITRVGATDEAMHKRPKTSESGEVTGTPVVAVETTTTPAEPVEATRTIAEAGVVNPLTHIPEHDPTIATLVNRRLNPIERHLRSLSEALTAFTSNAETQRSAQVAVREAIQRLEQRFIGDLEVMRDALQVAETDRRNKQEEIIKLLYEIRGERTRAPPSPPREHSSRAVTTYRNATPNGSNAFAMNYDRSTETEGVSRAVPQTSQLQDPVQEHLPVQVPTPHHIDELAGVRNCEDEDENLSPRRVAAPLSNASRDPAGLNAKDPVVEDRKSRIRDVVARQITVWLLETPHEFEPNGNRTLYMWARETSAGAFERVAARLSHFDGYAQAFHTLSTSLGNDAVEMSWFTRPYDTLTVTRARMNYAAWDPPPTDDEWRWECVLLKEVARTFDNALQSHVWQTEDDLTAAVKITKDAAAWCGVRPASERRRSRSGNHIATSQAHGTNQVV